MTMSLGDSHMENSQGQQICLLSRGATSPQVFEGWHSPMQMELSESITAPFVSERRQSPTPLVDIEVPVPHKQLPDGRLHTEVITAHSRPRRWQSLSQDKSLENSMMFCMPTGCTSPQVETGSLQTLSTHKPPLTPKVTSIPLSLPRRLDSTTTVHSLSCAPKCERQRQSANSFSASVPSTTNFISEGSSIICRICHEGESVEELVAPCQCAGTIGLIHTTCIEKWVNFANVDRCEICGYKFIIERRPKPFLQVSAWLCIFGAVHYSHYDNKHWETIGLFTLPVFLLILYIIWCGVALRYHIRIYHEWQEHNQVVKILAVRAKDLCGNTSPDNNNNSILAVVDNIVPAGTTQPENSLITTEQSHQIYPHAISVSKPSVAPHVKTPLSVFADIPLAASSPFYDSPEPTQGETYFDPAEMVGTQFSRSSNTCMGNDTGKVIGQLRALSTSDTSFSIPEFDLGKEMLISDEDANPVCVRQSNGYLQSKMDIDLLMETYV